MAKGRVAAGYATCVVLLIGYPGVGKRTVGDRLAQLLDAVLVDNQLINIPLLTLFKWDGRSPLPPSIWERVAPIREAVLGVIEDLAPVSNSYVFTNVLEENESSAAVYSRIRSLAQRRGSLFLTVVLDCDADEQARRVDNPDRAERLKGRDPEGYRRRREEVRLLSPPPGEAIRLDTTTASPEENSAIIRDELVRRGFAEVTVRPV